MLVNNAGVGALEPLLQSDVDAMEAMIDLNVTALTRLTYAAAPAFVARGGGAIINISSVVAIAPEVLNGIYGGTKAFVLGFSQSLHKELADKNVRIQAVLPGATATNFWDAAGGARRKSPEQDRHAVGRPGRCCACRLRSGRTRHHPLASQRSGLGRIRRGTSKAPAEPFPQFSAGAIPNRRCSVAKTAIVRMPPMTETSKVVHTARTRTTGGREQGISRSSDGRLDVRLALPGSDRIGTNPEHLFAAAWSACFETAIELGGRAEENHSARRRRDRRGSGPERRGQRRVPQRSLQRQPAGRRRAAAQGLIDEAHRTCPYSKATRGNMNVAIRLIE